MSSHNNVGNDANRQTIRFEWPALLRHFKANNSGVRLTSLI